MGLFVEGEASLKVSPDAKPVQLPPRAVPQRIMPELKKELDKMEQEGIIRPCPETTEWVHNIVTVVKKDGSVRLCLDPRNLSKYLIRNVHYTASWEDVLHSFKNGQYFSTLDAKSGYWTKKLDEQSQLLTAFNIHTYIHTCMYVCMCVCMCVCVCMYVCMYAFTSAYLRGRGYGNTPELWGLFSYWGHFGVPRKKTP